MILLASPSQTLCRRWRNALVGRYPLHEISDRQALIQSLREHKPRIVFLDHSEKHFGPNRIVCKTIKAVRGSRFIVLTAEPRENEAIEFIKAGARGYCAVSINAALIGKAAKVVSNGEIWIGRRLLPALFEEFARAAEVSSALIQTPIEAPSALPQFNGLSPREREITSLVASGQQNKFISNKLHISEKTVKAHLTTIFRKLGVDGRTQLAITVTGMRSHLPSNQL